MIEEILVTKKRLKFEPIYFMEDVKYKRPSVSNKKEGDSDSEEIPDNKEALDERRKAKPKVRKKGVHSYHVPKYTITSKGKGRLGYWYEQITQQENPMSKARSPVSLFAMIDGHRGPSVARFIQKHLMEVVYRSRDIMVRKRYDKGLKAVFIKMEELLSSKMAQEQFKSEVHTDDLSDFDIFKPREDLDERPEAKNVEWTCGAAMTIIVINSEQVYCASAGDCKALLTTVPEGAL